MLSEMENVDPFCIWAGPTESCSFQGLVHFIKEQDEIYQFGVTGLYLETPERVKYYEPSVSYLNDRMVIIGKKSKEEGLFPVRKLALPFEGRAWIILFAVAFFYVVIAAIIAYRYNDGRISAMDVIDVLFVGSGEHQSRAHKRVLELFARMIAVTFIVVVLFYELAVTNFLFQPVEEKLHKNLGALSDDDLSHFCITGRSALEEVWSKFGKCSVREQSSFQTFVRHTMLQLILMRFCV